MKKRVLALILTFSMVFTMLNSAFAADISGMRQRSGNSQLPAVYAASPSDFTDLPDDWSRGAIERAIENGLLSGAHGKINAGAQLTRAELAAIVVRVFGTTETASLSGFSDVNPSEWYYDALQKAVAMGILSGNNGKLNPNAPITREEVCVVLYRAFCLQDGGNAAQKFGDANKISGWAQAAVAAMAAKGYIAGDSAGNVNGSKTITRAEFAQMMDNLVKGYPSNAQGGVIEGNAVMKAGQNLSGMTIKGDLILADGLGRNDVDLSNCTVEGRIIVRGGNVVKLSGTTHAGGGVVAAVSTNLTNNTGSKLPSVSVEGENAEVTFSGAFGKVDVKADDVTINAAGDAKIDLVEISASGTNVEGSGDVAEVTVKSGSSDTSVTTNHTDITVENGGGTVTSNNGSLSAGETGTTDNKGALQAENKTAASASSSSGSSGNRRPNTGGSSGGGSSSTTRYTVTAENGQTIGTFERGTILTVDLNGGGDNYTVTVSGSTSIATPVRTGYTFNGWSVSGTTVTAQWTKNGDVPPAETVVVKDSEGNAISAEAFAVGTELTVDYDNGTAPFTVTVAKDMEPIAVPAKQGFVFIGWSVEGTTVTAQWRDETAPVENVTVKDSAGGTIGTFPVGTVLTIDKNDGTADAVSTVRVNADTVIPVPTWEGYTFTEWKIEGNVVTAQWEKNEDPGAEDVLVKDTVGREIGTFKAGDVLTVNYDNGTAVFEVTVAEDTVITAPTKDGYTFKEWSVAGLAVTAVWTENEPVTEDISLVKGNNVAKIYISETDPNYDGISLIAEAAADDIEAVTGQRPEVVTAEPESGVMIVAGTVNADIISTEGLTWDIAPSDDSFKSDDWERYQIQVKQSGGKTKVIVAGADKRGTIYGLFHITQDLCGVSPWIYWADAVPAHQDELTFTKEELEITSKRPSVNYRGFFLNDENPSLDGYADSHFGGLNYMFYDEVFELMLRLKGNYLWPAMWSNDFNLDGMEGVTGSFAELEKEYHSKLGGVMYIDVHPEDTTESNAININALGGQKIDNGLGYMKDGEYPMSLANAVLADRYGIVVGMSHHEPMARSGREWGFVKNQYYNKSDNVQGNDKGVWNFLLNPTNISDFWSDAIARNGSFDNLLTIGMRGENDSALKDADGNELTTEQNIELLKKVLEEQDKILKKFSLENTPQLIALYKEVENCWYGGDRNNPGAATGKGLRNDANVINLMGKETNRIVMLCEDNNGYLRTLPEIGQEDLYNWGMYYHFDYVGGPHTSMWMNTMPLQRTWDNMTTAYEYGVDDAWIVNVGDLKPMELPMSYFLDMAYDFDTYGSSNPNSVDEYTAEWVKQQFAGANLNETEVADVAALLDGYTKMNGDRKPERFLPENYSTVNYNEAQRQIADAAALEDLAEKCLKRFQNTNLYDAFYELVYYPAAQVANLNQLIPFIGLNYRYAERGSMLANIYADLAEERLDRDRELTAKYNQCGPTINGHSKWYRMMVTAPFPETVLGLAVKPHFNYKSWNPESSEPFDIRRVTGKTGSELIVDVQGVEKAATSGEITMLDFENTAKQAYALTLSNGGNEALESYTISGVPEWIRLDGMEPALLSEDITGGFYTSKTYGVSVDWSQVNENKTGSFTITSGNQTVTVNVNAKVIDTSVAADQKAAFPSNGEISIVANNYSSRSEGAVKWTELENYGKTGATMKMLSAHTDDYQAGAGPWIEYKAYVPQDQAGDYKLTVYFGQSNNVSFDEGDHLNIGLQVNNGSVETKNTLVNGYVAGGYTGWDSNIMNCGHTMDYGTYTLSAGENTIRIYGMDQNVMLQKLVLSKSGAAKTSYRGPQQTYMNSMGTVEQQPLVCYIAHEAMFLPGTIAAKDCANDSVSVSEGCLNAASGTTYTYPVKVTTSGKYLFNVVGKGNGTTVTLKIGDNTLDYELGSTEDSIPNEQDITLKPGDYTLELTVTGNAQIRSIMGEIYDDTPGIAMTISGTGGDADNISKAFDRKNSSAWKPTDNNPTVTLNLSEKAYADYFVLNGDFSNVTSVKLEVGNSDNDLKQVYNGSVTNGKKVYFQGTESISGKYWKFSFTGSVTKLSEIQLNTYTNWLIEDTKTKLSTTNTASPTGALDNLKNGNRQGPKNSGWLVNGEAEITVAFASARAIDGVNLIGMESDVSYGNGNGVIPTDTTYSGRAPTNFDVQYMQEDGNWSKAIQVKRSDGNTRPVLQYIDFGGTVTTRQLKIKAYGATETRMMEIEAIRSMSFTANGIDRTTQNWALSSNGGKVVSYTSENASETEYKKLNDGEVRSYESNCPTRESFGNPGAGKSRYVEVQLSEPIQLSKFNIYGQVATEGTSELIEPNETNENGFKIAPVMIQYFDGAQWQDAVEVAGDGKEYREHKILQSITNFGDKEVISNRIRLKYEGDFGDNIRLVELEAYGTPADMPEPEVPDPTDGLTNLASSATITATVNSGNPEGSTDALKDGDITYNNGQRWRIGTSGLPADITLDFGATKEISVVDVISQQPDASKDSSGQYPTPTLTTTTNLGLKDIEVYALGENDTWTKLATGDANNQLVWQRFTFDAVSTSKIKITVPDENAVTSWARFIEIQVWGKDAVNSQSDAPEIFTTERLEPQNLEITVGEEVSLPDLTEDTMLSSADAETTYNVQVQSSDSDVAAAEVLEDGTITLTGVAEGTAEITVQFTLDDEVAAELVLFVTVSAAETPDGDADQEDKAETEESGSEEHETVDSEEENSENDTPSEEEDSPAENSPEEELLNP